MPLFDGQQVQGIASVAVLGALIGLDRTALGQVMLSQPVVAGPLVGWLLGDLHAGMVIGAALELLWVLDMPIGTFVPADSTVSAVAATSIAALAHPGGAPHWLLGFCILLTAAIVPVTMFADRIMRTWNARLPDLAYCSRGVVTTARLTIAHLRGLAAFFMKSAALYLLVLPAGLAAAVWCMNAPEPLRRALDLFSRVMPLLGAAAVLRKLSLRLFDSLVLIGWALAAVLALMTSVPAAAVAAAAAAAGWMKVRYHGS